MVHCLENKLHPFSFIVLVLLLLWLFLRAACHQWKGYGQSRPFLKTILKVCNKHFFHSLSNQNQWQLCYINSTQRTSAYWQSTVEWWITVRKHISIFVQTEVLWTNARTYDALWVVSLWAESEERIYIDCWATTFIHNALWTFSFGQTNRKCPHCVVDTLICPHRVVGKNFGHRPKPMFECNIYQI